MSTATTSQRQSPLKVPEAQLYYEVQGSGPVLLMIPGGPTDAGIFTPLAVPLADRYTVVRYDPRGNSRSVVYDREKDQSMDLHGDDAARLLQTMGGEPALVLGSSGGAQIGLNLAARYPQLVKTLVAHEPPCVELLPNALEQRAFVDDVYNTYVSEGAGPAMQKFMAGAGIASRAQTQQTAPPTPEMVQTFGRIQQNVHYFLARGFKPISRYVPDVAALRKAPSRIVIGVGETSVGTLPRRTATALASLLGAEPVSFPGGHGGYNDDPTGFAEKLHQVLLSA